MLKKNLDNDANTFVTKSKTQVNKVEIKFYKNEPKGEINRSSML